MVNLKKVIDFFLNVFNSYRQATAGGKKLGWSSLLVFGPIMMMVPEMLSNAKAAGGEWETADDTARKELIAYMKSNFKMSDKEAEAKLEAGLSLLIKLGACVEDVKVLLGKVTAAAAAPKLESSKA